MDISERPKEVEEKNRVGDWEVDTIIGGGHRGAIVSAVDRRSKFTFLRKPGRKTAQEVGDFGIQVAFFKRHKTQAEGNQPLCRRRFRRTLHGRRNQIGTLVEFYRI